MTSKSSPGAPLRTQGDKVHKRPTDNLAFCLFGLIHQ